MNPMLIPTLVMGVVAVGLVLYAHRQGVHVQGFKQTYKMVLQILPVVACVLVVAGMLQVLISPAWCSKWIGTTSGLRGIIIGSVAGCLAPGGTLVTLPIAAALLRSGAGVGTMVAFMTSWSCWMAMRLPIEVGILGWKFTLVRLVSTAVLPVIAGLIAHVLFAEVEAF